MLWHSGHVTSSPLDRTALLTLDVDGGTFRLRRAERGIVPEALLGAIAAALRFNDPADDEAVELGKILASTGADEATAKITGLAPDHPLFPAVSAMVEEAKAAV